MKNILIVLNELPFPLKTGGHQAIFNGIKAYVGFYNINIVFRKLGRKNINIDVKSLKTALGDNSIEIYSYHHDHLKDGWKRIISYLFSSLSYKFYYDSTIDKLDIRLNYPNDYLEYLCQIIRDKRIDVVQIEMLDNAPIVYAIPNNVKKIFVNHELLNAVGFQRLIEYGETPQNIINYHLGVTREITLMNCYDRVITLSQIDKDKLISAGLEPTKTYASCAIVENPTKIDANSVINKKIVFIGGDEHEPNVVGIKWFLENCWNHLLEIDSEYRLYIVSNWGKNNISEIESRYPNVIFCGFMKDLSEILIGSTSIIPITIGSGIRMKILESVSRKVPFVSTLVGAEGLPFIDGQDCLLTNDPVVFVNDIIKLQKSEFRKSLVESAYEKYLLKYSFDIFAENRRSLIRNLFKN